MKVTDILKDVQKNKQSVHIVTNKETGETVQFTWDSDKPLTEEIIDNIFLNLPKIKQQQSIQRMEAEQPPQEFIENPNLYGYLGAAKEVSKQILEPGSLIMRDAGKKIHPVLGPLVSGLSYTAAKTATEGLERKLGETKQSVESTGDFIRRKVGQVGEGAMYDMGGQLIGAGIKGIGQGIVYVARKISDILPSMTEKGALTKVGNKLLRDMDIIDKDPLSQAALKKSEEVMDTIEGFFVPPAGQTGNPQLLQEFRTMIKSPGGGADTYSRNIVQNNQAIRSALNKAMGDGNIDDLINAINERQTIMSGKIVDLSAGPTKQQLGNTLMNPQGGILPTIKASEKMVHELAYNKIPNIPVNVTPIQDALYSVKSEISKVNESEYPKKTIEAIEQLLKGKQEAIPGLLKESDTIGFQNWHDLRKRISKEAWQAGQGLTPNLPLQRNLLSLQEGIDKALDITSSQAGDEIANTYKTAKILFQNYAKIFRKGPVGEVFQKGYETTGLKTPLSEITGKFTTSEGADGLINAIGKDNSQIVMREHYNQELSDYLKGGYDPIKIDRWLNNTERKTVFQKYGLFDEYVNLGRELRDYDVIKKATGIDIEKVIPSILGGGKDIGVNAQKLMNFARENPKVIQGIQKATADFILNEIETTGKTRTGEYFISNAKVINTLEKYKSALNIIYKDNPEKLKVLSVVQDAVEMMNRLQTSPTSGGSDTFELTGAKWGGLMRYIGNRVGVLIGIEVLGRKAGGITGASAGAAIGMVGWELLSKYSEKNINRFMIKAAFEPEFSKTVIMMAQNAPKEFISKRLAQQMATIGLFELNKEIKENKLEHVKNIRIF